LKLRGVIPDDPHKRIDPESRKMKFAKNVEFWVRAMRAPQ
jgi:hypothetical protein